MTRDEAIAAIVAAKYANCHPRLMSELAAGDVDMLVALDILKLDDAARGLEFDRDVVMRASRGADALYDQRTCRIYSWAAAARIRHLEEHLNEPKSANQRATDAMLAKSEHGIITVDRAIAAIEAAGLRIIEK